MSITASEARKELFPLIKKVNEDHDAIEIVSRRGNAVLVSAEDYAALREGAYLLRSPANARRLPPSRACPDRPWRDECPLAPGEAGIRGSGLGGLHVLAQDRP